MTDLFGKTTQKIKWMFKFLFATLNQTIKFYKCKTKGAKNMIKLFMLVPRDRRLLV